MLIEPDYDILTASSRILKKVYGGWVGGGGVPSEFSVLLWSKALVLDLDQAEQYEMFLNTLYCPVQVKIKSKQIFIVIYLIFYFSIYYHYPLIH